MKMLLRLIFLTLLAFPLATITVATLTSTVWASPSDSGKNGSSSEKSGRHDKDDHDDDDHDDDDDDDDDEEHEKRTIGSRNFKSLSSVIRQFNRSGKGRFLDVNVIHKKGVYYYKITYKRPDGKVGKVLYPASKTPASANQPRTNQNFKKSNN